MSWVAFAPIVLATAAILLVPGGVVAWFLRLRGFAVVALAGPLSVSLIAVAALGAGFVGIPWSLLPVLGLTALAAVAAWAWTRWVGAAHREARPQRRDTGALAVAVALPLLAISALLVWAVRDPGYFSQRYDNFFHLNAVRYVLDTGNASPLWVGSMTSPDGGLPFYPSGWHALVSLVAQASGASDVVATNAAIFVVAGLVWPVGVIYLARTVLGRGAVVTVAAGALSAAFPAFPYLPLHYGVLYPLFLGLACAPAALAIVWRVLRPGMLPRRHDGVLLIVLLVPGLGVAHPGALLAVLALSLPIVVAAFVWKAARAAGVARIGWALGLLGYLAVGVAVLTVVRPPADQIYWPTLESVPHAIGSVVSAAVFNYPVAVVVAALTAVGVYTAVRRPTLTRWILLGVAAVGAVLYIVVSASPSESLRNLLTGPWYNNTPRLASIWVIGVLPLTVLGAQHVVRRVLRARRAGALRRWGVHRPLAAVAVFGIVLTVLTHGAALRQASADIGYTYVVRDDAPIVDTDEFELMNRLDAIVPADAVIAGDPYTGASFAYALSGRKVLMPHLLMDVSEDADLINTEFAERADDPDMCRALEETGVRYILDFSAGGDFMENSADYDGFSDLAGSADVALVAEVGDARLYEITACGLGS